MVRNMAKEIFNKLFKSKLTKQNNSKKSLSKVNWSSIGTKVCNASIALLLGLGLVLTTTTKAQNNMNKYDNIEEIITSPNNNSEVDIPSEIDNEPTIPNEPTNPEEVEEKVESAYFNVNQISLYFGSQGYDWTDIEMAYVMKAVKQLDNELENVSFDIYYDKDVSFGTGTGSRQNSFNQIILQRAEKLNGNVVAAYYPIKNNANEIEGTNVYDENGTIMFSDYIFKFLELENNNNKISASYLSSLGPLQQYVNISMTNKQAKEVLENKANAIIMHELCHNSALQGSGHSKNSTDLMYAGSTVQTLSIDEVSKFNEKTNIKVSRDLNTVLDEASYELILGVLKEEFSTNSENIKFDNIEDVELIDYTNGTLNITFNDDKATDGENLLTSINIKLNEYQNTPNSLLDMYNILEKGIEDNNITINSYTYNSTLSEYLNETKFATSQAMSDTFLYNDLSAKESRKLTNIATLRSRSVSLVNVEQADKYTYTLDINLTFVVKNFMSGTRLNNYDTKIKIVSETELTDAEISQKINNGEFSVVTSKVNFLAENCSLFEQAKLEAENTSELSN